jgi:2-keto-3-deoxy-6-phosphogluconate aldolase
MSEVSNADSFKKSRDMPVGAVTVLTIDQVNQAVDAGATFIVRGSS